VLTEADAGSATHIDKRINLDGGRQEWSSMNAQVYRVNYALDAGSTQIAFGPAQHLGANDLFQLHRNVRTRKASTGSSRAQIGGGGQDLPTRSPNTTTADDGGGESQKRPLNAYKSSTGKLKVEPGTVASQSVTGTNLEVSYAIGNKAWVTLTRNSSGDAAAMTAIYPGVDSTTQASQLVYEIRDDGSGNPAIKNMLNGSQNVDSCGANHSWNLI